MAGDPVTVIKTEAEYEAALTEIRRLWDSAKGTPDGDRLDALVDRVVAYERSN